MALDVEYLFAPNASSVGTWVTRTRSSGSPRYDAIWRAIVPDALALGEDRQRGPSPPGTASADSGSRKACSMAWVRNDSLDHVGRPREGGVDVAALDLGDRQRVAAVVQLRRAVGQRGERVGDRLEHLVLAPRRALLLPGRLDAFRRNGGDHVADVGGDLVPLPRAGASRA